MNLSSSTKITITGDLGSGKSATAAILCALTGFQYVSTGKIQRQLAAELGMDTLALNRLADADPSIDARIDAIFSSLEDDEQGYVVDSRMAWFFLKNAYRVYLEIPVEIAAARILQDPNRNSEQYGSVEEAMQKILARKASENARFLQKYGADCSDKSNFDQVINTADKRPEEVAHLILSGIAASQAE